MLAALLYIDDIAMLCHHFKRINFVEHRCEMNGREVSLVKDVCFDGTATELNFLLEKLLGFKKWCKE